MATQIFINLPVKNLKKSMEFYGALGYHFNPQFTNDQAACMVISDTIFAMLVTYPFFATFTDKPIADATKTTEMLVCLSQENKGAVIDLVGKAVSAGGKATREPTDYGWMYGWGFNDLDGHIWEVAWMDVANMPKA